MASRSASRWLRAGLAAGLLVGLIAVASTASVREVSGEVVGWIERVRELPAAPVLAIAAFVVGGLIVAPLSLLILATVLAFGPLVGGLCAMAGALASGAVTFVFGRWLGQPTVDRLLGRHATRVEQWLRGNGVVMVAVMRNVPVAPYSVVNLIIGSSRVGFVDYMVGTFIGLLPGVVALAIFGEQVLRFAREPSPATVAGLVGALLLVAGLSLLVGGWLGRGRKERD